MKIILTFFYFILCALAVAQSTVVTKLPQIDSAFNQKLTGAFFIENKMFVGTQYVDNNWKAGRILLNSGNLIECDALKYNGLYDELIWLNVYNSGIFKLDKVGISDFWISVSGNNQKHFQKISISQDSPDSTKCIFAELVFDGKIKLYIERKISVKGVQFLMVNNIRRKYDVLQPAPIFYAKFPKSEYVIISKLNRKNITENLLIYKPDIRKIVKQHKLNLKTESDFIKLIGQLDFSVHN